MKQYFNFRDLREFMVFMGNQLMYSQRNAPLPLKGSVYLHKRYYLVCVYINNVLFMNVYCRIPLTLSITKT